MKRILIMAILILGFVSTKGQKNKPSKQETIDWIVEKIKNNINPIGDFVTDNGRIFATLKYKFLNYSNNKIVIQETQQLILADGKLTDEEVKVQTIDLTKVTSYSDMNQEEFALKGETLVSTYLNNETINFNYIILFGKFPNGDALNLVKMDKDLLVRFIKALDQLITYNSKEKKKEIY